jgi:hypothetical protein
VSRGAYDLIEEIAPGAAEIVLAEIERVRRR